MKTQVYVVVGRRRADLIHEFSSSLPALFNEIHHQFHNSSKAQKENVALTRFPSFSVELSPTHYKVTGEK